MRTVERLITASMVELRIVDPAGADARGCLRAYFAELTAAPRSRSTRRREHPPSRTSCGRRRAPS